MGVDFVDFRLGRLDFVDLRPVGASAAGEVNDLTFPYVDRVV